MERYRPPRRTGGSAGHPHGGPWSRVFVTGAAQTGLPCFSHGKSIRGGLTPGLPDEAGSLPAFAGSPWPDLPRCGPDRCSGPHPPVPALPTRTVPDPAPGRAGEHHRMRGCASDWGAIFQDPRMPAQAGIHLPPSPEALEDGAGDGPLPAQGPAGESANLYPRKMIVTPDGHRPSGGPSRVGAASVMGESGSVLPAIACDVLRGVVP
jgi:hypothetical protein